MKAVKVLKNKFMYLLMLSLIMSFALVGCAGNDEVTPSPTTEANKEVTPSEEPEPTDKVFTEVTIIDSTGEEIKITEEPMKVVSLAPNATEIIAALGAEDKLVGRTAYCNYPESVMSLPEIGGTYDPNVELIISLEPDLVVASGHAPEEAITKLREVGITVAYLKEDENFEGTYSTIEKIALILGKEDEAKVVIDEMKTKIADVKAEVAALNLEKLPTVYYATSYGESDFGAGGDTFIGEIIELAGGVNIADEVSGWAISKEQIADGDPDIIIVPAGEFNVLDGMKTADFYKDLRAIQDGNIFEINGDAISRQSPRVADALVEMAQKLHPELVK